MAQPCFVLRVFVVSKRIDWLDQQLTELDFGAREELSEPQREGRAVYSTDRDELERAARLIEHRHGVSEEHLEHRVEPVADQWQLEWLEHVEPVVCAGGLRIEIATPPTPPDPNTLYLEPALAFGYGEHPTTRLLLEWLEHKDAPQTDGCVLDVGCGTGVIALAALRLGFSSALGVDIEERAIEAARRNAVNNGLAARARFVSGSIAEVSGRFELVCANIELNTLLALAPEMVPRMSPTGQLALAGVLSEQSAELVSALRGLGVCAAPVAERDGWQLVLGELSGSRASRSAPGGDAGSASMR